MAYCATNGNLYENGKAFELKVGIGADFKVQASGTGSFQVGSFQVVGKLTQNGAEEVLMMVDLSDFSTVDTITTENVYAGDVSGYYSVTVKNVKGVNKIWGTITY